MKLLGQNLIYLIKHSDNKHKFENLITKYSDKIHLMYPPHLSFGEEKTPLYYALIMNRQWALDPLLNHAFHHYKESYDITPVVLKALCSGHHIEMTTLKNVFSFYCWFGDKSDIYKLLDAFMDRHQKNDIVELLMLFIRYSSSTAQIDIFFEVAHKARIDVSDVLMRMMPDGMYIKAATFPNKEDPQPDIYKNIYHVIKKPLIKIPYSKRTLNSDLYWVFQNLGEEVFKVVLSSMKMTWNMSPSPDDPKQRLLFVPECPAEVIEQILAETGLGRLQASFLSRNAATTSSRPSSYKPNFFELPSRRQNTEMVPSTLNHSNLAL